MSWAGRAVMLWAVLAGLFLMHGTATPLGGGCQAGVAVTAMTLTAVPVLPVAATQASAVPDTGHLAPADPMHAVHGGGMTCATRRSFTAPARAFAIPLATAATRTTALARMPAFLAVAFRPRCRPPGRPGLPLPLFLGVSRT